MTSPLFLHGDFVSASGLNLKWKINCDAMTDEDWQCLAQLVARHISFGSVYGVPTGGLKFAAALKPHADSNSKTVLIVDDVYTTGKTVTEFRKSLNLPDNTPTECVVVFCRTDVRPYWVRPIFDLRWPFRE